MPPLELWAWAFLWTLILEVPVVLVLLRRELPVLPVGLDVAIFVNAVTHPALWYVAPRFQPYVLWLIVMETAVVLAETALLAGALRLAGQPLGRAVRLGALAAVVANVWSTLVGLWLV